MPVSHFRSYLLFPRRLNFYCNIRVENIPISNMPYCNIPQYQLHIIFISKSKKYKYLQHFSGMGITAYGSGIGFKCQFAGRQQTANSLRVISFKLFLNFNITRIFQLTKLRTQVSCSCSGFLKNKPEFNLMILHQKAYNGKPELRV